MKLKINPLQYMIPFKGKRDSYQNVGHRAYISEYDQTQSVVLPDLSEDEYIYKYLGWFNVYAHKIQIESIAGDLLHYLHKEILRFSGKRLSNGRSAGIRKSVEIFVYNFLYGLKNNKIGMFASCAMGKWKKVSVINSEKVNAYCSLNHYLECVDYFEKMGYIIYVRGVKATNWTRSIGYSSNFGKFLFTDKLKDLVHIYSPKYKLIKFKKWCVPYYSDKDSESNDRLDESNECVTYSQDLCKNYNKMINKHDICLNDKEGERILNIDADLQRKFYRNDVNNRGRYYVSGGNVQTWNKNIRKNISIDNENTTEMDIKGTHLAILYSLKQLQMPSDPYYVPDQRKYFQFYNGVDCSEFHSEMRMFIKKSLLIMINARNYKSSHKAICSLLKKDYNKLLNEQLFPDVHKVHVAKLMRAIVDVHAPISEAFYSDAGIKLMGYESDVVSKVIEWGIANNVPVLQVYDSFICKDSDKEELVPVIINAWTEIFGCNNNLTLTF